MPAEKPFNLESSPNVTFFATSFLENQIEEKLLGHEKVKEILEKPKISISPNKELELVMKMQVYGKIGINPTVNLRVRVGLSGGLPTLIGSDIKADKFESKVKEELEPVIKNMPTDLVSYLEQAQGKKIKGVDIDNGAIKVEYESTQPKTHVPTPEKAWEPKPEAPPKSAPGVPKKPESNIGPKPEPTAEVAKPAQTEVKPANIVEEKTSTPRSETLKATLKTEMEGLESHLAKLKKDLEEAVSSKRGAERSKIIRQEIQKAETLLNNLRETIAGGPTEEIKEEINPEPQSEIIELAIEKPSPENLESKLITLEDIGEVTRKSLLRYEGMTEVGRPFVRMAQRSIVVEVKAKLKKRFREKNLSIRFEITTFNRDGSSPQVAGVRTIPEDGNLNLFINSNIMNGLRESVKVGDHKPKFVISDAGIEAHFVEAEPAEPNQESEEPKTGTYFIENPDGSEDFFQDGKLSSRTFKDGVKKFYTPDGKLAYTVTKDGKFIYPEKEKETEEATPPPAEAIVPPPETSNVEKEKRIQDIYRELDASRERRDEIEKRLFDLADEKKRLSDNDGYTWL